MTPHVHAELIKAWADGAKIQRKISGKWNDLCCDPSWSKDVEYHIKPEPPKPIVKYGLAWMPEWQTVWYADRSPIHNVKATYDAVSGALLTIEKI